MAFVQWTVLLAVLLVGPVVAVSPLDPVDVGQIVTNLGSYFEDLADRVLSVETANSVYEALPQEQFSIDELVRAVNLDRVVTDIMDISDNVLRAIETNSGQETVLEECCGSTGNESCCHRCFEHSISITLRREATNAGMTLSQEARSAQGAVAKASFEYGLKEGPLVQYPSPSGTCTAMDTRLQPWYSFAVTEPRTVAILLDISSNIEQHNSNELRNAAVRFLRSLNSKDKVSLTAYGVSTVSPPSCYDFVTATAENIDYLVQYVTSLGNLSHPPALNNAMTAAVERVNETDLIMSGRNGIVVVFSGVDGDFNAVANTVTGNPELTFRFVFPYRITLPPRIMALSTFLLEGETLALTPIIAVRNASSNQLEWTTSFDASTGAKSISFVRRLSTGADFHGVFHAEIYVSDLFAAALRSLAAKPLSYFFVTDNSAERPVIYHPLSEGNDVIQSIFEVEREFRTVVQGANDSNTINNVTVSSTNLLPMGPSDEDGILVDTHNYIYSCRSVLAISGFSNQLVLCVVLRSGADVEVTLNPPASQFSNLAYHTQLPRDRTCSFLAHRANRDSAVRLYGASQPAVGVSDSELHTYLTSGGNAPPEGVLQGVRVDSNAVSSLTTAWATNANDKITTWRYFYSDRGLFAVYPGIQLPGGYQPDETTWYRSALPHTNIALSPVEMDPLGGGFVYGISRRVVSSSAPHGVVGAHVAAASLALKVKEIAPACTSGDNRCYVFDSAGSIMYWDELLTSPPTSVQSLVEVTSQAPYLSHVLDDDRSFRVRQNCIDYSSRNLNGRHFFQYVWPDQEVNNTDTARCVHYRIRGIPGTNAMFAIASPSGATSCTPFCPCTNVCPTSQCPSYAASQQSQTCLCRCACPQGRDETVCDKMNGSYPTCPLLRETSPKFQPVNTDLTSTACLSTQNCPSLTNSSCLNTYSCLACASGCQDFTSCCVSSFRSGFAVCANPTLPPVAPTLSTNIVAIVVPIVLIVVLIVIVFVGLMLWYNIRIKGKEDPARRKHRGAFDFSREKNVDEDAAAAKIKEVNADQDLEQEKKLSITAPEELGESPVEEEKAEITDTAV